MARLADPATEQVDDAGVYETPPDTSAALADNTADGTVADSATADTANAAVIQRLSPFRVALGWGLVVVLVLAGVVGWLGYRAHQVQQAQHQRAVVLQVARQGAVNLTTIDSDHVESDIQRVLDSSTGAFYEDFQKRAPAFAEVVRQAQAKSEGTVVEAGIESMTSDSAQVLVAVRVITSNAGAQQQEPRHWRMRITVQEAGDESKVANVGFVL